LALAQRTVEVRYSLVTPSGERLLDEVYRRLEQAGDHHLWRSMRELAVIGTVDPPGAFLPEGVRPARAGNAGFDSNFPMRNFGKITITKDLPVFVSMVCEGVIYGTTELVEPIERLEIVVDPEEMLGRFRGKEIAVRLRAVDATTGEELSPESASLLGTNVFSTGNRPAQYDSDGAILFKLSKTGPYKLELVVAGYEPYRCEVTIPDEPVVDLGSIRLERGTVVRGVAVDEADRPIQCAFVLERDDPYDLGAPIRQYMSTDENGEFAVECGPSTYRLRFSDEGWAPQTIQIEASRDSQESLRVVLKRGTAVKIVSNTSGRRLVIRNESGEPVMERYLSQGKASTFRLLPGSYRLEMMEKDDIVDMMPFVVGGDPMELTIE
jgi:hypothetical protein